MVVSASPAVTEGRATEISIISTRRLTVDIDDVDEGRALTAEVAAQPLNLKSHQRRIAYYSGRDGLSAGERDPARLFSALVDLFLVLGDKALELRRTLLEEHAADLCRDHYELLLRHLKSGLSFFHANLEANASVFNTAYCGGLNLVQRRHADSFLDMGDADYAHAFWQQGQCDEAMTLLEKAVLADPANVCLRHELLSFYQQSRDYKRFTAMQLRLSESLARLGETLPESWRQLR